MHRVLFALLCTAGLAGCAATPSPYGNFIPEAPEGVGRTVAEDAVKQLTVVYPPANTRFDLQQPTPDPFGTWLSQSLRAKGYAVQEGAAPPGAQGRTARGEGGMAAGAPVVLPLRYVFDQAANLYRVTLLVGEGSLTRAYLAQNGAVHPAGAWVRKE
ncbi:MAG TPA: conjugal transfer protein TrbH [Noviherbaspirillum sp.]